MSIIHPSIGPDAASTVAMGDANVSMCSFLPDAELRKALAAHRLHLKDAAAAAGGRRQPNISQQMNSRLADMQNYLASSR
jgi:hypothetical protein